MTADDLKTDRQAFGREAARHGDRRVPHDRDVVARLHPVDVRLHRHAINLRGVRLVDAERHRLHGRQDEELVALHEPPHAVIQLRAFRLRRCDVGGGQPLAAIDLPENRLLHQIAMARDSGGDAGEKRQRAHGLEDGVEVGEVRLRLLHDAAERFEHPPLRVHHVANLAFHGSAAEIRPPCDARALDVALERLREQAAGLVDGNRRTRVRTCNRAQQERHVGHGARHRALDAQRRPRGRRWPCRHASRRRPHADDAAEARGIAERAAHVAAVGNRQHPGRERDRRAAAASAAGPGAVMRIQRGSEHRIERLRAGAELRRVRLADDDRARLPQALDDQRVFRRNEVLENRRPERRPDAFGRLQILVRDRQAVERTDEAAVGEILVGLPCVIKRLIGNQGHDRVQSRIDALDLREVSADDVASGYFPCAKPPRELDGTQLADV